MEALAVLGGGVWLAKSLLDAPQRPVNPTRAELREQMPETPREFLMHEFRENGMIAPNFASSTNRVPWDPLNPPYHIHRVGEHHMDNPMEECFTLRTNGLEHNRLDWQEQFVKGKLFILFRRTTSRNRLGHLLLQARFCCLPLLSRKMHLCCNIASHKASNASAHTDKKEIKQSVTPTHFLFFCRSSKCGAQNQTAALQWLQRRDGACSRSPHAAHGMELFASFADRPRLQRRSAVGKSNSQGPSVVYAGCVLPHCERFAVSLRAVLIKFCSFSRQFDS